MNTASRKKGTDVFYYWYRSVPFVNHNPVQWQNFGNPT
jgi:hypothetical protein